MVSRLAERQASATGRHAGLGADRLDLSTRTVDSDREAAAGAGPGDDVRLPGLQLAGGVQQPLDRGRVDQVGYQVAVRRDREGDADLQRKLRRHSVILVLVL